MKAYYYFLFRMYWFFRDSIKEGHKMSLISTSLLSTLFVYFLIVSIIGAFYYFSVEIIPSLGIYYKVVLIPAMFALWSINYYYFVKPRDFLRKDFKKDKKGGLLIFFVFLLIGILFFMGTNKNREKIFKEPEKARIESF
jgi:hypothetical protein